MHPPCVVLDSSFEACLNWWIPRAALWRDQGHASCAAVHRHAPHNSPRHQPIISLSLPQCPSEISCFRRQTQAHVIWLMLTWTGMPSEEAGRPGLGGVRSLWDTPPCPADSRLSHLSSSRRRHGAASCPIANIATVVSQVADLYTHSLPHCPTLAPTTSIAQP